MSIQPETLYEDHTDEDYYSKPTVDISKKIEKVKEQAEREINEIAQLEDLKQLVQDTDKYSYGWFKALLDLESLNSGENNSNSREISISFAKGPISGRNRPCRRYKLRPPPPATAIT